MNRTKAAGLSTMIAICGLIPSMSLGQANSQRLVPAQFNAVTDGLGFRWDLHSSYGYVQYGQNNTFSSAGRLYVNGNSFRTTSSQMTSDGSEFFMSGIAPNLQIVRRIKIDKKNSAARFVDIFTNNTANAVNASVQIRTTLGQRPCQSITSETGKPVTTALGKNDGGMLAFTQPTGSSGQLSVLFELASPRSKIKPIINIQGNQQFYFTYTLSIPPNKSVALVHGLAQRSLGAVPDTKGIKSLFKTFRSRTWTSGLPATVRKAIVNSGGVRLDDWAAANVLESLEALNVDRGAFDILAVSEKTRLRGSASCESLTLATGYGEMKTAWENVAALIGGAGPATKETVLLRDGQVLHGKLRLEDLKFTTSSGVAIDIKVEQLDRLVTKETAKDGQPLQGVFAFLETTSGERLALARSDEHRITVITPWGERAIPWDEIVRFESARDQLGFRVGLQDGSRLFAYVSQKTVTINTLAFGAQEFPVSEIRTIIPATQNETDNSETLVPHVLLAGENLMIGQVDLSHLNFVLSGQSVPVPTSQIRVLRNVSDQFDGPPSGPATAFFEAELWDGGILNGRMAERVLPVRNGNEILQVRARDIEEIHRPTPTVPESLRRTIAQRIRDLGSTEFEAREAASREILELGFLAKQQLNEALGRTEDPEVRRRVEQLLAELPE